MDAIKEGETPVPVWLNQISKRCRPHVTFARDYVRRHNHGTPGHINLVAIDELATLADVLTTTKDGAYTERNKCLVLIALMARRLGINVGIGQDPAAEDSTWANILYIDLPAGQVSWHIHEDETSLFYFVGAYDGKWDGHDTAEKYRRVLEPGL